MTDNNYDVKDISLATKGRFKVEWAEQEMPVLQLERLGAIASQVCCRWCQRITEGEQ